MKGETWGVLDEEIEDSDSEIYIMTLFLDDKVQHLTIPTDIDIDIDSDDKVQS